MRMLPEMASAAISRRTNGVDISEDEQATIRLAEPFAAPRTRTNIFRCQVF